MKASLITSLTILTICSITSFAQVANLVDQLPAKQPKPASQAESTRTAQAPPQSKPTPKYSPPPPAPKRVKQSLPLNWKAVGLFAALEGSTAFDLESTFRTLDRCPNCYEANPIMRPLIKAGRPTSYAVTTGLNVFAFWASLKLRQEGKKWWWVPMTAHTGIHLFAGIHNSRIKSY